MYYKIHHSTIVQFQLFYFDQVACITEIYCKVHNSQLQFTIDNRFISLINIKDSKHLVDGDTHGISLQRTTDHDGIVSLCYYDKIS